MDMSHMWASIKGKKHYEVMNFSFLNSFVRKSHDFETLYYRHCYQKIKGSTNKSYKWWETRSTKWIIEHD